MGAVLDLIPRLDELAQAKSEFARRACERAQKRRRRRRPGVPTFGRPANSVCDRLRARLRQQIALANRMSFGSGSPQQRAAALQRLRQIRISIIRQMQRVGCSVGVDTPRARVT